MKYVEYMILVEFQTQKCGYKVPKILFLITYYTFSQISIKNTDTYTNVNKPFFKLMTFPACNNLEY